MESDEGEGGREREGGRVVSEQENKRIERLKNKGERNGLSLKPLGKKNETKEKNEKKAAERNGVRKGTKAERKRNKEEGSVMECRRRESGAF